MSELLRDTCLKTCSRTRTNARKTINQSFAAADGCAWRGENNGTIRQQSFLIAVLAYITARSSLYSRSSGSLEYLSRYSRTWQAAEFGVCVARCVALLMDLPLT